MPLTKGQIVARMERSDIRERRCESLVRSRISLTLNAGYELSGATIEN